MQAIIKLLKWLWRAWPFFGILLLILTRFLLIYYFSFNASSTDKFLSLASQMIGGFFILHSIDSNIGIINEKKLFSIFSNYLREFPLIKRSVVLQAHSASTATFSSTVNATVSRNPISIEEKLEYLQDQIDTIKRDIELESKELSAKIDRCSNELNIKIQDTRLALGKMDSKIKEGSIGGLNEQIFGVLLTEVFRVVVASTVKS
jgi:hypothetical protein